MVKILQINSSANVGSTGRIAEQIGCAIIREGWDSYIAYGRYVAESKSKLIKVGDGRISQMLHIFISRLFDAHGLGSTIPTMLFIRKLKRLKPDLVHLHNIHGYFLNYSILFRYLSKNDIPVVWTLHDCWSFTGHCGYFVSVDCEKWQTGCGGCPLTKSYPQSMFFDCSKRNYNKKKGLFTAVSRMTLVPVSSWLGRVVSHSFFHDKRIKVIYNGIDISVFHPISDIQSLIETYNLRGKRILIGVASAWHLGKGLMDYFKLAKILPDDYKIVLVGLDKSKQFQVPDEILTIPLTWSQSELAAWYSVADVSLNLSYQETFGLTTIEAMACGTPGIVYNRTASPELITEETGKIVEAGNMDELKNAIFELCAKGKSYYSEHCRQRAIQHYDKNKAYKEYINLYKELINNK